MRQLGWVVAMVMSAALVSAQRQAKTLDIYVVDVEGGNASLFVSPTGESLLIDTGNGGMAAPRDAGRIVEAAKDAGISQIDHLITTHWHGDHFGAMEIVASKLPIKQYIDHGGSVEIAVTFEGAASEWVSKDLSIATRRRRQAF